MTEALKVNDGKSLFVVAESSENLFLSGRNIQGLLWCVPQH